MPRERRDRLARRLDGYFRDALQRRNSQATITPLSLEDARNAIRNAYDNFRDRDNRFNDRSVIRNVVGNNWNYGYPSMYRVNRLNADELASWWEHRAPGNEALELIYKQYLDCYQINLQATSGSGRLFNFHVSVRP